jgi:hypothetical protein
MISMTFLFGAAMFVVVDFWAEVDLPDKELPW